MPSPLEPSHLLGAMAAVFAAALPSLAFPAPATYPGQREGDFVVKDFRFRGGESLPEVRLHYTTIGTPRRDATGRIANAVLLLHGTTGTSRQFFQPTTGPELFGPGQPLDAARTYVIVPDGLGRGGSTKPSDGLRAKFPRYGYADVVKAQHLLVTEGLGVDHLRAVIGTSMGGMHAWMWAEMYPDLMDGVVPLSCQPVEISGRNWMGRRAAAEAIRHDPDWQEGEYRAPPRHWIYTAPLWPMMLDSAAHLQAEAPTRQAALDLYDRMVETARKTYDANDLLSWVESSWDYDPQPDLGKIKARVMAVNFADDAINPAELPLMEGLIRSIPSARFVLVPASDKTVGHMTLTRAAVWKPYLEELLRSLPGDVEGR
jgi:homoserine O-acetyltransferase